MIKYITTGSDITYSQVFLTMLRFSCAAAPLLLYLFSIYALPRCSKLSDGANAQPLARNESSSIPALGFVRVDSLSLQEASARRRQSCRFLQYTVLMRIKTWRGLSPSKPMGGCNDCSLPRLPVQGARRSRAGVVFPYAFQLRKLITAERQRICRTGPGELPEAPLRPWN